MEAEGAEPELSELDSQSSGCLESTDLARFERRAQDYVESGESEGAEQSGTGGSGDEGGAGGAGSERGGDEGAPGAGE